MIIKLLTEHPFGVSKLKGGCTGSSEYTFVKNATFLEITCGGSIIGLCFLTLYIRVTTKYEL